jgi:hypothetical protein
VQQETTGKADEKRETSVQNNWYLGTLNWLQITKSFNSKQNELSSIMVQSFSDILFLFNFVNNATNIENKFLLIHIYSATGNVKLRSAGYSTWSYRSYRMNSQCPVITDSLCNLVLFKTWMELQGLEYIWKSIYHISIQFHEHSYYGNWILATWGAKETSVSFIWSWKHSWNPLYSLQYMLGTWTHTNSGADELLSPVPWFHYGYSCFHKPGSSWTHFLHPEKQVSIIWSLMTFHLTGNIVSITKTKISILTFNYDNLVYPIICCLFWAS